MCNTNYNSHYCNQGGTWGGQWGWNPWWCYCYPNYPNCPGRVQDTGLRVKTVSLGSIDTVLTPTEDEGVNQAFAGLIFGGANLKCGKISNISAYVTDTGTGTGPFQMAVLRATSATTAQVIGVTNTVTSITAGVFTLPLTSKVELVGGNSYYLAVYNQVPGSELGAVVAGLGAVTDAPPINFRVQNLNGGFTVGQTVSTTDVSVGKTPWLAATRGSGHPVV